MEKSEKSEASLDTTRRSFIKKSIVASVAASNLTMFSGLVSASQYNGGPSNQGGWPSRILLPCNLNSPGGERPDGYWCPCTDSNNTTPVWGAKCDDKHGRNAVSYCF